MTEIAVFGGGCFWCTEAVFQELKGVMAVTSGYAGGASHSPTYEQVASGKTGHAEVVKVEFDPSIITYTDLLGVFFGTHNPTTKDRQGADVGTEYRSLILTTTPEQAAQAKQMIGELNASGELGAPIITEVKPLDAFYEAEEHHKDYYKNNPQAAYCQVVIDPKIAKFRAKYAHLLRTADNKSE